MAERRVSGTAWIALALGVLILPLRWMLAAFTAAAFHEACHYAAIRLCGGRVTDFRITSGGAVMETEGLGRGAELFCALAGPLGGLLLLFTGRVLPAVAVCALMQSAYNLLPLYPLDGGRALRCGARLILPPRGADMVCRCLEWICMAALAVGGIYAAVVLNLGALPLIVPAGVILKKYLANRRVSEYNVSNTEARCHYD